MALINRGDKGPAVILLQGMLQKLGHAIKADGVFGEATEGAVRAFQQGAEVDVDGKVGEETANALVQELYYWESEDD